jgi:hypothetical protein
MRIVATAYDLDHRPTRVFRNDLPKTWQLEPFDHRLETIRSNIAMVSDRLIHALRADREEFHAIEIAVST